MGQIQQYRHARRQGRIQRRRALILFARLGTGQAVLGGFALGCGAPGAWYDSTAFALLGLELGRQALAAYHHLRIPQRAAWVGLLTGGLCAVPCALACVAPQGITPPVSLLANPRDCWEFVLVVGACVGSWRATTHHPRPWGALVLGLGVGLVQVAVGAPDRITDATTHALASGAGVWVASALARWLLHEPPRLCQLRPHDRAVARTVTPD